MAVTNQERVGKALELLKAGLGPFVEREVQDKIKAGGVHMDVIRRFVDDPHLADRSIEQWDVAALLKLMWETWNDVFRNVLGRAERSLVSEIRDHRNMWAHQDSFSSDDADRALDSITRLLTAVSAPQADEVNRMKMELRRLVLRSRRAANVAAALVRASRARPPAASSPGARSWLRIATWPAAATSRPNSPPTCGRSISAKERLSTAIQWSSSAAPI